MFYLIRIASHLDRSWEPWFAPLQLAHEARGTTVLSGQISDQAALYGVLLKLNRLGVTLLAVEQREAAHETPDPTEKPYGV